MRWNLLLTQLCCPFLQLSKILVLQVSVPTAAITPSSSWVSFSIKERLTKSFVSARKLSLPCGWPGICTRSCQLMWGTSSHPLIQMISKQDMRRSNKNLTVRELHKRSSKRLLRCILMLSNKDALMLKNYSATNTSSLSSWRITLEPFHHFVFPSF